MKGSDKDEAYDTDGNVEEDIMFACSTDCGSSFATVIPDDGDLVFGIKKDIESYQSYIQIMNTTQNSVLAFYVYCNSENSDWTISPQKGFMLPNSPQIISLTCPFYNKAPEQMENNIIYIKALPLDERMFKVEEIDKYSSSEVIWHRTNINILFTLNIVSTIFEPTLIHKDSSSTIDKYSRNNQVTSDSTGTEKE